MTQFIKNPCAGTPGPMETAPRDGKTPILIDVEGVWMEGEWMIYPDSTRKSRWLIFQYPRNAFADAGECPVEFRRWMPKP
jgi:hypothetical protein